MTSLSPNSAENFEDQGGRHYVLSMYIKIFRDISTYILTRYRFYNDGFIVKPQPRANTIKREKKKLQYGRVSHFLETFIFRKKEKRVPKICPLDF